MNARLLRRGLSRLAIDRKISKEVDLSDFPALHFSITEPPRAKKRRQRLDDRLKIIV
jgi:hypothetical protein